MKNDVLRTMWDGRAEQHAARKQDQASNPTSQLYNDSWWRHIEPLLPKFPNGEILEAGCGTGRWAEHLVPMGFSLTCSDLSPGMLTKAREDAELKGYADRITFKELDICDLYPFEDKQFDMVISTGEPVSLCSDPQKAISEYCRVVRPGGYVLCDAGNKYRHAFDMFRDTPSPEFMHTLETGEFTTVGKMQLHLFGPSEFANVFEKLGMKICTLAGITPMFSFPPQQTLNKALENPEMKNTLEKLERDYAERPEVIALSSRLIVIAHKPL